MTSARMVPAVGDPPAPKTAPAAWRLVLSFLIFVHLFYLFAGVLSDAGPFTPVRGPYASNLQLRFRQVPGLRPYLQLLFMDMSYRFYLTYADSADTDHVLIVELNAADGSTATKVYPPEGIAPSIRRMRYMRAAQRLDQMDDAGQDTPVSILAKGFAQSALADVETGSGAVGQITCRRHYCQSIQQARSANAQDRDPYNPQYYEDCYRARVLVVRGEVQVIKQEEAGETAPAAPGAAAPDTSPLDRVRGSVAPGSLPQEGSNP